MSSSHSASLTGIVLLLFINGLQAQETVTASGGHATGPNGSVAYSVGQVAYTVNTAEGGTTIQGVQQPYEIFIVTGTDLIEGIALEVLVYPNPTSEFLKLTVENSWQGDLTYQLFNLRGSLLENGQIRHRETTMDTGHLTPGAYYLKITGNKNGETMTFKIIKN